MKGQCDIDTPAGKESPDDADSPREESESDRLHDHDQDLYDRQRDAKFRQQQAELQSLENIVKSLLILESMRKYKDLVRDTTHIIFQYLTETGFPISTSTLSPSPRAWKLLTFLLGILIWSLALTLGLTALIYWMRGQGEVLDYINTFAEGFSGGAFISTIAGTLIPHLSLYSYQCDWEKSTGRILGMVFFQLGLLTALITERLETHLEN